MSQPPPRIYFKELRLQQFRALAQLLDHATFEDAGRSLRLSRTSVWRQVRALEREVGAKLVEAGTREVHLTREGRILAELARPLIGDFEQVLHEFEHRRAQTDDVLSIASTPQLLTYDLPPAIAALRRTHPALHIRFHSSTSEECLALLQSNVADVAIIGHQEAAARDEGLLYKPLHDYPFVLLTPPDHALAKKKRVTLTDLCEVPLILPARGLWPRTHLDSVFAAKALNRRLHIVMETSYSRTAVPYVRMGYGLAITSLSPLLIASEIQPAVACGELCLKPLKHLFGGEGIFFVCKKLPAQRSSIAALRSLLSAGTEANREVLVPHGGAMRRSAKTLA